MVVWGVWNPAEKVGTSGVGKARALQGHKSVRPVVFAGREAKGCVRLGGNRAAVVKKQ